MNKKILLLFALIIYSLSINAQQCQNLTIDVNEANCAIPTTTLKANFLNSSYQTTDNYRIGTEDQILCDPPIDNSPPVSVTIDDGFSYIINMGFTFCYYGNMYDQIIVNDNGFVTFDLSQAELHVGNSYTIPNGFTLPNPQEQTNAIYACWMDTYTPSAPSPGDAIQFRLLNQDQPGNRIFVVDWKHVPMFIGTNTFLSCSLYLYETSNVIETNIYEVGVSSTNNGRGLIGIQNKSGTLGFSPPGREAGTWPASFDNIVGEKYTFIPDGNPLQYSFQWSADFGDGNGYVELTPNQNSPAEIVVNPDDETTYKAELVYQGECSFNEVVISEEVTVTPTLADNIQQPLDLFLCENVFATGTAEFNIDQNDILLAQYIVNPGNTYNINDFTISYFENENDRDDDLNEITTLDPYIATDGTTIYVRIVYDDGTVNCFDVFQEFNLAVTLLADTDFSYAETFYCNSANNPTPIANTIGGEYTIDNGGVIAPLTGTIDLVASSAGDDGTGEFNITYTVINSHLDENGDVDLDCPNATTITINIGLIGDADFTYPSTACISDNTNPAPIQFNTGGVFSINNGGTIDSTTGVIDLTTTAPGVYLITYDFDLGGNCPSSDNQTITIYAEDDATFNYPSTTYCNDDDNPLPSTTSGDFSINNGGVIDINTGIVDLSASGLGNDASGNFTITFTTNGNCPNSSEVDLSIELRKDTAFSFPTDVCFYDTNPQAFDVIENGGTFSVDNGASISSNGILDLATTTAGTTYTITYGFLGVLCESSTMNTITVNESPTASTPTTLLSACNNGDGTANFDIASLEDEIIGSQSGIILTFHPTNDDATNNINIISTQPFARVDNNVWARLENNNGCFSIVEVPLEIENCYIVLPQGFSPSSNNPANQVFDVRNLRVKFPKYKLFIYNRYGQTVYEGDANDENWNGKLNNEGDLLPVGSYFYGIKLNDEQDLKYRGWIYLQQ